MYFQKYLLTLRAINFCFYQKVLYTTSLKKLFHWNSCLLVFFKKIKNQIDLLINRGPSWLFEKFSQKLRINFIKMATKTLKHHLTASSANKNFTRHSKTELFQMWQCQ